MIINPRHATALSRSSSLALRTPRKSRNSRHSPKSVALPLSLQWAHYGMLHQITAWPDVRVEKNYGGEWIPVRPSAELLEAASLELSRRGHSAHWDSYLDFVPQSEREFIQHFEFNRVSALLAVAHCPMLLPELRRTPALIVFLAEQFELRSEGEAQCGVRTGGNLGRTRMAGPARNNAHAAHTGRSGITRFAAPLSEAATCPTLGRGAAGSFFLRADRWPLAKAYTSFNLLVSRPSKGRLIPIGCVEP